jgi:thioredoxin reductase
VLDVIIVGAGPAGLSAALMLGRCRRRVLVCDCQQPRNRASRGLHGYLTRDGIEPLELLRLGREELCRYDIEVLCARVVGAVRDDEHFEVMLESGLRRTARTLLLATGVRDRLPAVPGLEECYGISVHHCPYCDGWESRDKKLVVFGRHGAAAGLALSLKTWSDDVTICSNGKAAIGLVHRRQLSAHDIHIHETRIVRLEHADGYVRSIVFASGESLPCDAVFFATGQSPQSDLTDRFGCKLTRAGSVKTDHLGQTHVPGLYVVGDASRDVQFAIVAAAEGAKAAVAINKALQAQVGLTVAPQMA